MRITCETKDTLPLDALAEFQGGLKKRGDGDYEKIRKSIDKYGFATPFFVWAHDGVNHVLDGHGRLETLKRMRAAGEEIPPLPIVRVDCKDEAAAKMNSKESTLSELSIFDPVLCETMYTWFCKPGGTILDPFAGGSVRGIVASYKHMDYTGFDIRPEQIAANERQRHICDGNEKTPRWICGDSARMDETLAESDTFDFVFSCPPYADLEKYSDIDGDISNMDYPRFLETYRKIIKAACSHLKENRFAVFVVGEVRKKTGAYHGFIPDTIKAFEDAGLKYYNELILLNVAGGKAYTAGHDAKQSRKIAKVHQNILAFVKGDADEAAKIHEQVLVFLKGESKQANADLGDFVSDNCVLPKACE